ncbi:MKRN2 opposite strand protein [Sabethes cyaneus]|uniref:MKRN2 opposite strand protein n=1 Tax=Sabethes cyaneus TaxID=53552 RepID=UPI00237E006C|nr:MKRN2 opposite strand protein [Sabethes cyaneus]
MSPDDEPHVICFKHCRNHIFVLKVPVQCPLCNHPLEQCKNLLPFGLPYPFVVANQSPCSVVLRPSVGDFLSDFHNNVDLHIAVTDSQGAIVEFDSPGLLRTANRSVDRKLWGQSLVIVTVPDAWFHHWDTTIVRVIEEQGWKRRIYDSDKLNCYSFVLAFLRLLLYEPIAAFVENTEAFSRQLIVPKTTQAAKYITIYRKIKQFGFLSEPDL